MTFEPKKDFQNLEFYVWMIKGHERDVLIAGSKAAMKTFADSLRTMPDMVAAHGSSTRRFKVNPPRQVDTKGMMSTKTGKPVFIWFSMLVVKSMTDAVESVVIENNQVIWIVNSVDILLLSKSIESSIFLGI
jgi:hypothetical protein